MTGKIAFMHLHAPPELETVMKKPQHLRTIAAALVAAGIASAISTGARAEAPAVDTTAPFSVAARLDFRIIIPGFLRFRVGTNIINTVDMITFSPLAADVGNSVSQAGTGGDAGGGSGANVFVQANNGQVTITETNNSLGLGLGTGTASDGYISYAQITTAVSVDAAFLAPALSNAGGGTSTPTLNAGKVTNRTAVWTYGYANTTFPSAGTYGGVGINGGRVTYTATTP